MWLFLQVGDVPKGGVGLLVKASLNGPKGDKGPYRACWARGFSMGPLCMGPVPTVNKSQTWALALSVVLEWPM